MQRVLNILFILVLLGVLTASYFYQFFYHDDPCPLCLLQRMGMVGLTMALAMNIRFGIKVEHYGLAILCALLGRIVSLRQIGLHVFPSFQSHGSPVFGFDLYVWSFIVFSCALFACAVLLILYGFSKQKEHAAVWDFWDKLTFYLAGLVSAANIITTLIECGFTNCD